jgi:predicted transcriptional regulator of viral defense system
MAEALRLGLSRKLLYQLRDEGIVQSVSRGLYRLASLPPLRNPGLVTVAARIPKGVVCLVSALAHHELTTQVPRSVDVAIERGATTTRPRIDDPPLRVHRFSGGAFKQGIEIHKLDGFPVRIYCAEKTITDCFKYRHKLGMEVVLEALRTWKRRRGAKMDALLRFGKTCRVAVVMRPYLEALA